MLNRPAIVRLFASICLIMVMACPGWAACGPKSHVATCRASLSSGSRRSGTAAPRTSSRGAMDWLKTNKKREL